MPSKHEIRVINEPKTGPREKMNIIAKSITVNLLRKLLILMGIDGTGKLSIILS